MNKDNAKQVIIIGSGIAGLSAAIYTSRGGNDTLVIKGDEPGGQLTLTTEVANYPGFPDSVGGQELIEKTEKQAKKFGTEFESGQVTNVNKNDDVIEVNTQSGEKYICNALIVASGSSARKLGVDGEDELMGYGVSTCATCDGAFFRGEDMIVVGGGDSAFEEALFLTKFANKVTIIHRREGLRVQDYLKDKVEKKIEEDQIEMKLNTEVQEIHGNKNEGIEKVDLVTNPSGYPSEKLNDDMTEEWSMNVGAVFIAIGHTPNTSFLDNSEVQLDDQNYMVSKNTDEDGMDTKTHVDGIFVAGDVFDSHYQQAATAAGSGVKSAMDVNNYLDNH